jgi:hypothetical protein
MIFIQLVVRVSIPSPRLGDRKHTTRWIKIILHHKPWEILYLLNKGQYLQQNWLKDIVLLLKISVIPMIILLNTTLIL